MTGRYRPPPGLDHQHRPVAEWAANTLNQIHSRGLGAIAKLDDDEYALYRDATHWHHEAWQTHLNHMRALYIRAIQDTADQIGTEAVADGRAA